MFNKQPDIDGHLCSNPIKQPTGVDIHKLPLKPQHLLHSKKLKEVIGNFTHLQMLKDQSNSLINPKLVLVQKRLESASKLMGMKFFGRSANEFGKIRDLNSSILEELLLWSEQAGQFDEIVSSIKGLVDLFGTVKRKQGNRKCGVKVLTCNPFEGGSPKQDFISRSKDLMDKADLEKLKELLLINLKAIKI